jgi:hypothetical protein
MGVIKTNTFEPYIPSTYDKDKQSILYHNSHTPTDVLFLSENEYKSYNKLITNLLNKHVNTTLGKKVYLGKLSNLPRHKVKEFFIENKVNKTSRVDQSNTIVINKSHLVEFNKMFSSGTSFHLLKPTKIYTFESSQDNDFIIRNAKTYTNNYQKDILCTILINDNNKSKLTPKLVNFLNDKENYDGYYKNLYREKNIAELYFYLEYLLKNPNVNVIFDEDLMAPLNQEGFELDEEYLTTLDGMFESKSQDNINLALEMLSNVNIEKYSLTIALFLNKHKDKFAWGSGLSITQNNSFKSTLKYFKSKNINFESDWRSFSTNLYKLHKDNPENITIITDFVQQNINQYLKVFNPNDFMEIKLESLAFKG